MWAVVADGTWRGARGCSEGVRVAEGAGVALEAAAGEFCDRGGKWRRIHPFAELRACEVNPGQVGDHHVGRASDGSVEKGVVEKLRASSHDTCLHVKSARSSISCVVLKRVGSKYEFSLESIDAAASPPASIETVGFVPGDGVARHCNDGVATSHIQRTTSCGVAVGNRTSRDRDDRAGYGAVYYDACTATTS